MSVIVYYVLFLTLAFAFTWARVRSYRRLNPVRRPRQVKGPQ